MLILPLALLALSGGTLDPCAAQGGCCKICQAGKACGDSCIPRDKVCRKGRGCACHG